MNMLSIMDIDHELLLFFNGSNSSFMDSFVFLLSSGLTWIPLYIALLYIVVKNNETMAQIVLIVTCAVLSVFLADFMADFIAKPYFQRWRPSNDPLIKYAVHIVNNVRGTKYGFFSAHAANTFSLAIFFCLLVRNRLFGALMIFWSLLNGYTRIYLGLHYPGDVLCGWAWGAVSGLIGYAVYHKIYYRISPKINYISTQFTSTGYSLADLMVVLNVFLFSVVYVIFRALIEAA